VCRLARPLYCLAPLRGAVVLTEPHLTHSQHKPAVKTPGDRDEQLEHWLRDGWTPQGERGTGSGHEDGVPQDVGRRLRRLTSYQASPRLVVTGSSTLVGNPDDVPPAAYSGEWVPGSTRGAPKGGWRSFSSTPSLAWRGSLTQ